MYRLRITLVGLFALALGACGGNNPQTDEFVAATPDVDGLTLEIGDGSTIHPTLDVGSSLESQATPAAADNEYLLVASGAIRRTAGDWIHRGRGYLGFDLDNLYTLNPPSETPVWPGKGKLFAGFGHLGGAKALIYVLENFTPDGVLPVQNAVMVGWKKASGAARVRVASLNDFIAGNSGGGAEKVDELLLSRAIWWGERAGAARAGPLLCHEACRPAP